MHRPESVSVLNYSDYRSYLRDQFHAFHARNRRFSLGAWSRRLGLNTPSALTMIIKGQRNPGPNLIETFIRDLRLTGREAAFFRDLVWLEKCRGDQSQKTLIMARLAELHPRKVFREIDSRAFRAISNWYYYVLRELVDLPDFREDARWIQKRLRVALSIREIEEAIVTLVDLGLLKRDARGKLFYTQQVETASDIPDEGLKRYHEQMLSFAQLSLRSVDPGLREISGMTFTLNKKDLPRAKELLRQVQYDLAQLGKAPCDEVYHVEVALFPFTEEKK